MLWLICLNRFYFFLKAAVTFRGLEEDPRWEKHSEDNRWEKWGVLVNIWNPSCPSFLAVKHMGTPSKHVIFAHEGKRWPWRRRRNNGGRSQLSADAVGSPQPAGGSQHRCLPSWSAFTIIRWRGCAEPIGWQKPGIIADCYNASLYLISKGNN